MAASGRTSAPVAACGILVVLGAPNSYNFIYSRFPFNGRIGAFTSEPSATAIFRQRMFCWSEGLLTRNRPCRRRSQQVGASEPATSSLWKTLLVRFLKRMEFPEDHRKCTPFTQFRDKCREWSRNGITTTAKRQ
jgi:hypothetical protein